MYNLWSNHKLLKRIRIGISRLSFFNDLNIISLNNFFFAAKDDICYSIYNEKWALQSSEKYDEIKLLVNGNYLILLSHKR